MTQILFIELLGGLGDVLIALPAIQALTASHSQAHMTVLTFAPGDSLLHHHPQVHRVLRAPAGQARQAVAEALRSPYDLVVTDATYDGIADLVRQSEAPRTVTNLWRNPPTDQGVSDRMLQILLHEGLISEATAREHRHPRLHPTVEECDRVQTQLLSLGHPRIALYPDAGMTIKQWSPDRFVALGRLLHQRYGASLIVPAGADPEQAQAIVDQLESTTLWPRGSLRDLAALFAQLDCVVAVDTGPARIAAAVGTPTVTLFGPAWQGRYGQPAPHINLQGYAPCPERNIVNFTEQACWYSGTCPFVWDTCVNLIAPKQVAGAINKILERGSEGARSAEFVLAEGRNDSVKALDRIGSLNSSVLGNFENSSSSQTIPNVLDEGRTGGNHIRVAQHPNLKASPIDVLHVGKSSWQNSPPAALPLPLSPWLNARNLLVMRLDNIGDVLMTAPALQAIKETIPHTRLTLMASPAGAMAAPLLPWVDEVLPWRVLWQTLGQPPGDVEQELALIDDLKSQQFDGAIIFTSFKQSPHPAALICQMAGIPLRLGASQETGECLTHRIADLPSDLHQVERNLRLVETAGFRVQSRQLSLVIPPSAHVPAGPYLLLNPWASCSSRMYDLERFAIAARALSDKTGWPVVVTGTAKDRAAATPLLATLGPHAIDLIGQTSLGDLVALVAQARLLLSNNTSTMHIADATQTPSVILFAGTELERQWQPRQTRARLLRRPTPCSPCYAFTCPYELECLDIPPEDVVTAGLALLNFEFCPMHITFVSGSYRPDQDGVADYLANLRSHLDQRHAASTVLTAHDSARAVSDPTVQGALTHWALPQLWPLVQKILATPTDILHIQHAAGSYRFERSVFLLPLLLRRAGYSRPIVTTAHEYGWWEWQPKWFPASWLERLKEWGQKRTWWDREDGFLLTGSDAIITTNQNITGIMQERLPTLRDRMVTVPIAANLTVVPVDRAMARSQLRQECGWPQEAQVIAFFGFLHPVKGLTYLLQGFRQVRDRHPQARLLLIGGVETLSLNGPDAENFWQQIQTQIRDLQLTDAVHCTGYVEAETASRYLSGADLGVLPFTPGVSLKSGSLLAMLAHRLPTIATHTAETDVVLSDRRVIAPIAPRSGDALAKAITALLENPAEREQLAAAGHDFVQVFTWEGITDRHCDIYQQLLER